MPNEYKPVDVAEISLDDAKQAQGELNLMLMDRHLRMAEVAALVSIARSLENISQSSYDVSSSLDSLAANVS